MAIIDGAADRQVRVGAEPFRVRFAQRSAQSLGHTRTAAAGSIVILSVTPQRGRQAFIKLMPDSQAAVVALGGRRLKIVVVIIGVVERSDRGCMIDVKAGIGVEIIAWRIGE